MEKKINCDAAEGRTMKGNRTEEIINELTQKIREEGGAAIIISTSGGKIIASGSGVLGAQAALLITLLKTNDNLFNMIGEILTGLVMVKGADLDKLLKKSMDHADLTKMGVIACFMELKKALSQDGRPGEGLDILGMMHGGPQS